MPGALLRPDIVGAQATLEARQAQVGAISRQRLPEVELQARRGSFYGQGASGTALRAVITLPIFDFGSIGREKKAAQAEVRAQQAQIEIDLLHKSSVEIGDGGKEVESQSKPFSSVSVSAAQDTEAFEITQDVFHFDAPRRERGFAFSARH